MLGADVRLFGLQRPRPVAGLYVPARPTTEIAVALTIGIANAMDWVRSAMITKHGMTVFVAAHWVPSRLATALTAGMSGVPAEIEPAGTAADPGTAADAIAGTGGCAGMNGLNRVAGTDAAPAKVEPIATAATAVTAGMVTGGTGATAGISADPEDPATPWSSVRASVADRFVLCRYTGRTAGIEFAGRRGGVANGLPGSAGTNAEPGVTTTSAPKTV